MTETQLLLLSMLALVVSLWAASGLWVLKSDNAWKALSRAARSIAIPVLGLSVVALVVQGDQAWRWWIVNAVTMGLALVVDRRLRALALTAQRETLDGDA